MAFNPTNNGAYFYYRFLKVMTPSLPSRPWARMSFGSPRVHRNERKLIMKLAASATPAFFKSRELGVVVTKISLDPAPQAR